MSILDATLNAIDLANDNGLSTIGGHSAQQNHNAYKAFYNLLANVKPSRILEIGTAIGGFTQFLRIATNELGMQNTIIRSYDIDRKPWYEDMLIAGIDVRVTNIFVHNADNTAWETVTSDVIDFIREDGVCMVLCDGGNKPSEFNVLSQFLKTGDLIMAHDYAPNKEYFDTHMKGKIWNWHEIKDQDINSAIANNSLSPYLYNEMLEVAWACYRKEL